MRPVMMSSLLIAALFGCREDPGDPVYPEFGPAEAVVDPDALPGPFPFEPGDERLSIGIFYEGQFSEEIVLDNQTSNFFVFGPPDAPLTFRTADSTDRVEGLLSTQWIVNPDPIWWGGGVIFDPARDLTGWTTLHVSLKASDALFENTTIKIGQDGNASVNAFDFGFRADGQWHALVIPVTEFTGIDMSNVRLGFSMNNVEGTTDSILSVDDLYYTKE